MILAEIDMAVTTIACGVLAGVVFVLWRVVRGWSKG